MTITNALTATAATRPAPALGRALTLMGIYQTDEANRALVRTQTGALHMLTQDAPQDGMTLIEIGDGWAILREHDAVHRLVLA